LSLPDPATLICPNSIFGVANQPTDLPEMRSIRPRASLRSEEAIMAKNKNRERRQSPSPQPTPDQRSRPQPQPAPTPADMPRKRQQRRFGHN
jgi:hypothetical protein